MRAVTGCDPLISAYDKQARARNSLNTAPARNACCGRSGNCFRAPICSPTPRTHTSSLNAGVAREKVHVVYVGAEEALFTPAPVPRPPNNPVEVLFYGSFIPLQGPRVIIEAARLYQGPPVNWVLLGNGPLLDDCKRKAAGLPNVTFENWLPYADLPDRVRRADILLGVFGTTPKAQRVIPNKVFQALACGKPVVTCSAPTYPAKISETAAGITFVTADRPDELADAVGRLAINPERLQPHGRTARALYERHFSFAHIAQQLAGALRE